MNGSFLWKVFAVALVAGVFYVGHGLHQAADLGAPSLLPAAQAGQQPAKTAFVWETVAREGNSTDFDVHTQRARVPGGWFVWQSEVRGKGIGAGITFYPDANHVWDGSTLPAGPQRR